MSLQPWIDEEGNEVKAVGASGALTSGDVLPMWQAPLSLVESYARRAKKGNDKGYPIHNWRGGLEDVAFIRDRANHAMTHMMKLLNGDTSVDTAQGNVDAVTWFMGMANEVLRLRPDLWAKAFYAEARGEIVK